VAPVEMNDLANDITRDWIRLCCRRLLLSTPSATDDTQIINKDGKENGLGSTKGLTAHIQKGSSGMMSTFRFVAPSIRLRSGRLGSNGGVLLLIAAAGFFLATGCSKTKVKPLNQSTGRDYTLGKKIVFGESGDSERFRVSGWSSTEKEITWTEGPLAVLEFTGLPSSTPLRLKMTLSALVNPPQLPSQPVEVYANGQKIASWEVTGKAEFTALIPPKREADEETLKIELRIPKAVSPKELGLNNDPRVLGISCFDIMIAKAG
jgi:hypothetical protein